MLNVPSIRLLWVPLLALFAAAPNHARAQNSATVVYLVRHAEKVDASHDPALTADGNARAALLSEVLRDAGLTHIHSTDLERTRETAAPVARRSGLEVNLYDPEALEGFAQMLRATPGRHLVSGHSDTTPTLVRLLGGESSDIPDHEYDRLYVLTLQPDGGTTTVLIRFGPLSAG
jgi:broad specificity phosphatase PhoE